MENEGSKILHTRLSRRQTDTQTGTSLSTQLRHFYHRAWKHPLSTGGGLEGARLHPSTFPGCGTERGLCNPGRNAPHRSGNGSGAAGAETLGAAAKKSACPSLTRASQLKQSRVPDLLLRATSVGLSHDVLVSLRQDLWWHDVLLDQASINLPRATESSPPATCRRRTQRRVHFALCRCRSHPGTLEETQGLH